MKVNCFNLSLLKFYILAECQETYLSLELEIKITLLKLPRCPYTDIL